MATGDGLCCERVRTQRKRADSLFSAAAHSPLPIKHNSSGAVGGKVIQPHGAVT